MNLGARAPCPNVEPPLTATDQEDTNDACSFADETENINEETCPFVRDAHVVTSFLPITYLC